MSTAVADDRGQLERPNRLRATGRRRRLDTFDLGVLAVLAGISLWVMALNLTQLVLHGGVWTGTDGLFPVDQLQYQAWVRDASRHLFVSDLFVLRRTPHDYLEPVVAISGGLTTVGVAPWVALLLWKPVSVGAMFFAVRAYCRRALVGRWARRAALVLGLFFGSFGVLGDEWIPFWSWGYPLGLLAVASMVGALVAYDRARRQSRRIWLAPVLGLLASWLHPWQGEELLLIIVALELGALGTSLRAGDDRWRRRRKALPIAMIVATALPLMYYVVLQHADPAWGLAQGTKQSWSLVTVVLPLLPLLLLAVPAYARRPETFVAATARIWPVATLSVWALSEIGLGAGSLHGWAGITIPLAVLAVEEVQRVGAVRLTRHRWLGAGAVAAATIPASIYMMIAATGYLRVAPLNIINHREKEALEYLARDRDDGGVLASYYFGEVIPGQTGRRTFVGDCSWSVPDCSGRMNAAQQLFDGPQSPDAARAFVLSTGARFLFQDCRSHADLTRPLAPIIRSVHHFGCATVFEVVTTPRS